MTTVDGKVILAGLTTGSVLIWDLSHNSSSNSMNVSANLTLTNTNRIRLLPKRALDAHTDVVTCLAACASHNFVVSASRDHSAVIWHLSRFTFIRQLGKHPGAVTAVAVNDSTVRVFVKINIEKFLFRTLLIIIF